MRSTRKSTRKTPAARRSIKPKSTPGQVSAGAALLVLSSVTREQNRVACEILRRHGTEPEDSFILEVLHARYRHLFAAADTLTRRTGVTREVLDEALCAVMDTPNARGKLQEAYRDAGRS